MVYKKVGAPYYYPIHVHIIHTKSISTIFPLGVLYTGVLQQLVLQNTETCSFLESPASHLLFIAASCRRRPVTSDVFGRQLQSVCGTVVQAKQVGHVPRGVSLNVIGEPGESGLPLLESGKLRLYHVASAVHVVADIVVVDVAFRLCITTLRLQSPEVVDAARDVVRISSDTEHSDLIAFRLLVIESIDINFSFCVSQICL